MGAAGERSAPVQLVELRVLDGPNLYFTVPAIKLTLRVQPLLEAPESSVARMVERSQVPAPRRPGPPGSGQRRRYLSHFAARVTRALATAAGARIAVRGRPGAEPDQVVVAYPWRHRNAAEVLGREAVELLIVAAQGRRSFTRASAEAARRVLEADPGPPPAVPRPTIPVVAVTGTNGKTTTVRLLAHLVRTAGKRVAYTSTDGVYLDDQLAEEGDYSGYGGAGHALAQPGVEVAVLETARGGILLRGIGTTHNDAAIVTNVSEDHLGQYGIRTLDQLAEVKATITRVTRPEGWDVLNADDPRVLAMRRHASGRPWIFTLDPEHPAIRSILRDGGRAITVLDGWFVVIDPQQGERQLVALEDVPVTLAGISSHHIQNAMGATAAALGIGIPEDAVIRGLKSFVLDPERNPGRANLFELGERVIVVDYAHNEEGMKGLIETCRRLRPSRARIWLTFGAAGDRTDAILHRLAYTAARGADRVGVAELLRYLRGRDRRDLLNRLQAGAIAGGAKEVPTFEDEMHALRWMLEASDPGDVVAITALAQRPQVFTFMQEQGAQRVTPERLKELVKRARNGA